MVELDTAVSTYSSFVSNLITRLESVQSRNILVYTFSDLPRIIPLLKEIFSNNIMLLAEKTKSPSNKILLKTIFDLCDSAAKEIALANEKIAMHNNIVATIGEEKTTVRKLVWKYLATQAAETLTDYSRKENGNNRAIQSLNSKILSENVMLDDLKNRLRELEEQITSVAYTVTEINRILASFHFHNFTLAESEHVGHYKIVRPDYSDAKETLSEGEFTFITFLYFYQLVNGSHSNTGVITNRVVVIDDPISSLDSNVLFIVSNLIKQLIKNCKADTGIVKQVFVLTHNIYFHKEVSFLGSRENQSNAESYWIIRKQSGSSTIKKGLKNQVQTTYELLWAEIRDSESLNSVTIFNTLRRILEYYFKIIGHVDYERIVDQFEFEDKQACKALISWINDGSHFVNDDLLVDTEFESIDRYLSVFKDIFDKLGHLSHYSMMIQRNQSMPEQESSEP